MGAGSSMSRIAGMVMPFACYYAIENGNYMSPYKIFLFFALAALIATLNLPFDTTGRILDGLGNESIQDNYATTLASNITY